MVNRQPMSTSVGDELHVERVADGVAVLTLNRPDHGNALRVETCEALPALLANLAADESLRALVLTGAGSTFSVGADLDAVQQLTRRSRDDLAGFLRRVMQATTTLAQFPRLTVAAIGGPVAGGALGLALACDLRLATPTAKLRSPFIRVGLVPDYGVSWLLPRVVGAGPALELLLTGRSVDGREAEALGMVTRLSDDPLADAIELAKAVASHPPQAVARTIDLIRNSDRIDLEEAIEAEAHLQALCLTGPEPTQLLTAFTREITGGDHASSRTVLQAREP